MGKNQASRRGEELRVRFIFLHVWARAATPAMFATLRSMQKNEAHPRMRLPLTKGEQSTLLSKWIEKDEI